jgi:SAM-dependent methyltransferase
VNPPDDLPAYYAARAAEYEQVYAKPERQADLAALTALLRARLRDEDLLEIACGTGYWTTRLAPDARSILATDITEETLALARTKPYPPGRVRFARADAFDLRGLGGGFSAAFAGFWWSHIARAALPGFLAGLHGALGPGRRVVFVDNRYVPGSNHPITRRDPAGDTHQRRTLANGAAYEVRKNFPTADELRATLRDLATEIEVVELTYYWLLAYRVAGRRDGAP